MSNKLQFKVSSALKNIIGSDLINDDLIAVFELVKNSYDAHASEVIIKFIDIYGENPKISIIDNGKGMNYDDLVNKWLFVAYSAKKDGTEEDSYDYRSKIESKRAYAGAKGIGRFSCDRLGSYLYLETTKDESNPSTEILMTDWDKFEENLKDEFVNIDVEHESVDKKNSEHGTKLEITKLKNVWNRSKILKLKDSLAKLINPNTHNSDNSFQIYIESKEEASTDKKYKNYKDIVNGKIENLIFDTLNLKTTKVVSTVSGLDENIITTTLYEGGKLVYEIKESNKFEKLQNIELVTYFLNHSAKLTFKRRMGVDLVNFGNVFIYKNGLRIYPYGERGEDPLKLDQRKSQGTRRYLGTRELLGYISINEPNPFLRETSSRGDGLERNDSYMQMREWFLSSLKKLEKFIIDIVDWGTDLSDDEYINLDAEEKVVKLEKLIKNLTRSNNILEFKASPEIFKILDRRSEGTASNSLSKVVEYIKNKDFDKDKVLSELKNTEKKIDKLRKIKNESEDEAINAIIEKEGLEKDLELSTKKGAFQGALISTDKERIIGLQHQIYHSSSRINRNIKLLLKKVTLNSEVEKHIRVISLESSKINSIANYITKANFNLNASEINDDIVAFICDYIREIYLSDDRILDIGLIIKLVGQNVIFKRSFRPLEITMIIDNFITNSSKFGAKKIVFEFSRESSALDIIIRDDGTGIKQENFSKIFQLGYTTTNGSGIGLHQIHSLVTDSLKGKIDVSSVLGSSTTFRVSINEN